ncbi:hypothetical protein F4806DRAFT_496706 [Annulohypoxylon nitens]|nr:hypothetical protein F4806DRAFT_496706 [Annulohypoxylon nitens]
MFVMEMWKLGFDKFDVFLSENPDVWRNGAMPQTYSNKAEIATPDGIAAYHLWRDSRGETTFLMTGSQ